MTLRDLLATAGVEERVCVAGPVGVLALHGGLEGGTAEAAEAVAAAAGASLYAVWQPAAVAVHVPSHRFDPDDSPALAGFLEHVEVAISLHGYGRAGRADPILLGGRNRALAGLVAMEVRARAPEVRTVTDVERIPPGLRGLHPANPVNRPRRGGVQLELPHVVRGSRPGAHNRGLPCAPDDRVVAALVHVARSYTA